MNNIFKYLIYILLFIFGEVIAKDVIIEIKNNNVNTLGKAITENSKFSDSLILKFNDNYYDMSNLPSEKINIYVTSNITFSGFSNGTYFDFKNDNKGFMKIKYLKDEINTIKFENIIFKNYGKDVDGSNNMISVNFESDKNYLKFENCTFIDNQYIIFDMNVSYNKEDYKMTLNSDYFITFDNCNF